MLVKNEKGLFVCLHITRNSVKESIPQAVFPGKTSVYVDIFLKKRLITVTG